jgi:hypothetical protein
LQDTVVPAFTMDLVSLCQLAIVQPLLIYWHNDVGISMAIWSRLMTMRGGTGIERPEIRTKNCDRLRFP